MKAKRKARPGEYVCDCSAYRFPHRFGGGKCSGVWLAEGQWARSFGRGRCEHCNSHNRTGPVPYCEVVEGSEDPGECPVFQEFVESYEIIIKG